MLSKIWKITARRSTQRSTERLRSGHGRRLTFRARPSSTMRRGTLTTRRRAAVTGQDISREFNLDCLHALFTVGLHDIALDCTACMRPHHAKMPLYPYPYPVPNSNATAPYLNALHRWRRFKLIYGDGTNGWRFEAAIMAIIIANVVTLAMYDPTTAVDVGRNAALQVRICRFFNYLSNGIC